MKRSTKTLIISAVVILAASAMSYIFIKTNKSAGVSIEGYDLDNPAVYIELPEILNEISGLTDIDHNTIASVQDEEGIVFIYDLEKNEIKNQIVFHEDGDYEGITRIAEVLYVLRSDGNLFEITDYESTDYQIHEYETGIPIKNNEGLGYDPAHHRLLIAGKSKPKIDGYKGRKVVYGFDLVTKTISEKPIYEFRESDINEFVEEKNGKSEEGLTIKINPSAIAVHPITGKLFVLSAKDYMIYVFDQTGKVEAAQHLDKKMFNKAEGITFWENGDMLISNEGQDDKSTLLQFPYRIK